MNNKKQNKRTLFNILFPMKSIKPEHLDQVTSTIGDDEDWPMGEEIVDDAYSLATGRDLLTDVMISGLVGAPIASILLLGICFIISLFCQ